MTNPVYAVLLIVAGTLSILIAGLAWRGRNAAGVFALAVMSLGLTIWSWMYAWYWLASGLQIKLLALDLAYIGVVIVAPAFLVMTLEFAGLGNWLSSRFYVLLGIVPAITLAMVWSDPLHPCRGNRCLFAQ